MHTMHFRKNCNVLPFMQISLIAQMLLTVPLSFSKAFWETKRKSEATC